MITSSILAFQPRSPRGRRCRWLENTETSPAWIWWCPYAGPEIQPPTSQAWRLWLPVVIQKTRNSLFRISRNTLALEFYVRWFNFPTLVQFFLKHYEYWIQMSKAIFSPGMPIEIPVTIPAPILAEPPICTGIQSEGTLEPFVWKPAWWPSEFRNSTQRCGRCS